MTPDELRRWRLAQGWSQATASTALHVPLPTYENWEQARRQIPPMLGLICFHVTHHGLVPTEVVADWLLTLPASDVNS